MASFILFSSFPLLLASLMHTSKYLELYRDYISEYSFQTIKNLPLQMSDVHMSRLFQFISQLLRWKTNSKSFGERAVCTPVCLRVKGEVCVTWDACGGQRKASGFGFCFPLCLETSSPLCTPGSLVHKL